MSLKTLMVHLGTNTSNDHLLMLAADLASAYQARIIGIMAFEALPVYMGEGFLVADVVSAERARLEKIVNDTQECFRNMLEGAATQLEWQASVCEGTPEAWVAEAASAADLVITAGRSPHKALTDLDFNLGALVMRTGRPVLVVPAGITKLKLDNVMVAWKGSRETRRAVHDALPLLRRSTTVKVVQVAKAEQLDEARESLHGVVKWLASHGVKAVAEVVKSSGDDVAGIEEAASAMHADLIVAGAYGHTRLQEWFLGGVTRDLMMQTHRCVLISH